MYKNQLQELAQRSCFNLPSYACIREGPDHAPRFKATVNFNGEVFESPTFCTTLRHAEHAAAEVALSTLSKRGPSRSLAAKVLDETGVYKNLLQETAHRAGLKLPVYTTIRSGPGHTPIFSCTVELAGMSFNGEPAKTKKQAQKNAAMAAWSALKQLPHFGSSSASSSSQPEEPNDEQEQVTVARALAGMHQSEGNKQPPPRSDRRQNSQQRPAVIRRDRSPVSDYSYYPIPFHSWAYPSFSPDAAIYQMWQQAQASQQQNHMLTLAAPPQATDPRFLPILQSMFQPAQGQFYSGVGQDRISPMPFFPQSTTPVLPMHSDYSSPAPLNSRSQVTIKEIHEGKSQLEDKDWSTAPKTINLQPDASQVPEGSSDRETDIALTGFNLVPSESDTSMGKDSCENKKAQDKQMEGSPRMPFEWVPGSSIWPRPPSPCRTQSPNPFEPSRSMSGAHPPASASSARARGFRPLHMSAPMRSGLRAEGLRHRGSSLAAPVTIRTAVPVCSARPGPVNQNSRVPSAHFMAPAVHVRTVVPVCSAPPVRAPDSAQKSGQDPEGSKGVSSEFAKLQI